MNTEKLKNKILQLAVQGKLVEQDPNDEPVSVLLKKIQKEKERLVKEKKIKKSKPLPPVMEDEIPFEIPEGWGMIRFGDIAVYKKGPFGSNITKSMFIPKSDTAIKVYEQKNAIQKKCDIGNYYITKEKFEEMKSFEVFPGDIIVSCAGTIGETYVMPDIMEKGIINQALMKITLSEFINKEFYLMYFKYILTSEITTRSKGSAMKNIPTLKHLKNIVFPLPPLNEQKRIAEKVDKLFAIIEQLDNNKDELLKTINNTRNKILQLAIQGKLVPQDPTDEPASILLEKIKEEKERLIKEGKIKRSKPLPPITEDEIPFEIPFEIPEGWEWVRLGEITSFINGDRGKNYPKRYELVEHGIPFINAGHLKKSIIDITNMNYITLDKYNMLNSGKIEINDVVYCLRGTLGKCSINNNIKKGAIASSLVIIRGYEFINTKYLYYYLISPLGKLMIKKYDNGTAQPNLSAEKVKLFSFPLPPLNEQKRIVEKIDKLMALCNEIEKQIIESKYYSGAC